MAGTGAAVLFRGAPFSPPLLLLHLYIPASPVLSAQHVWLPHSCPSLFPLARRHALARPPLCGTVGQAGDPVGPALALRFSPASHVSSELHARCMCLPPPLHSFWARGQIRPLLCGIVRRAGDPAGHQQAIKSTRAGKKRHIDRRRSSIHIYRCSRCPSPTPKGRRLPSESSSAPTEARGFTYTNTRRALLDYPRDSDLPNGRHRSGVVQPPNAPSTM